MEERIKETRRQSSRKTFLFFEITRNIENALENVCVKPLVAIGSTIISRAPMKKCVMRRKKCALKIESYNSVVADFYRTARNESG